MILVVRSSDSSLGKRKHLQNSEAKGHDQICPLEYGCEGASAEGKHVEGVELLGLGCWLGVVCAVGGVRRGRSSGQCPVPAGQLGGSWCLMEQQPFRGKKSQVHLALLSFGWLWDTVF